MSIIEIEMYSVECDNCKDVYSDEYSAWGDSGSAEEYATDSDWFRGEDNTEHEGKHYCDACYSTGDNDEVYYAIKRDETYIKLVDGKKWKLICKGSELTEEVAEGLVDILPDGYGVDWFKDYTVIDTQLHDDYTFLNALESFKSYIEAQGYYWSKNDLTDSILAPDIDEWHEAESKTFNPDKTLIFEIL